MPVENNLIAAEVLATCSALGSEIRGKYVKSSDCLSCLKDLVLYLRRDDEEHTILRQLGELKVLQNDLLPILKQYSRNKEIFLMTLRLLVILTNPAFLLYKEEVPQEKSALNIYLNIISCLQSYKQAFTDPKVWTALYDQLKQLLSVNSEDRDEDDRFTIERILIVIRNILHVPPNEMDEKRTDDDASLHDQVLWALHLSKMEDLILYLSQNDNEHFYCLHVLEIISLMLREQTPEVLVAAGQRRTEMEKDEDTKRLMMMRKKESEARAKMAKHLASHRFSGSYYVKNVRSISDRDYITHKFLTEKDTIKFDAEKSSKRTPKNRLPAADANVSRRSTLTICLFLKQFCSDIISNSYNVLMASVKRELSNKRPDDHDDSYYLWAVQYFLDFNRRHNFQLDAVSETVSVHTFHYVQSQIESYYEMLLADKKKAKNWSRRMHLGVKAYRQLLETLKVMDSSTDSTVKTCSEVIKNNIFYVAEYRELLLTLLVNYDEVKFSLLFLVDLVQTTYLFLKMLEQYSKGRTEIIVQGKKRKRPRKNKARKKKSTQETSEQDEINQRWFDLTGELSAVLQGRRPVPADVMPFDAASAVSFEEQKLDAVSKICDELVEKEPAKAVAFLRAARELWPEDNAFGPPDIGPEDEFLLLREIFLAELQKRGPPPTEENGVEEQMEDEDEEEAVEEYTTHEQKLNISNFLLKFASPKVVRPCCHLLANYKTNSVSTNTALLKLMHRIAWDCKMYAMFFQASIFVVFQKILHDPDKEFEPIIKELGRFCKFIISKFFEVSSTNKKVFVEMLFWKGQREAFEIEEGYESYPTASAKQPKKKKKNRSGEEPEDDALLEGPVHAEEFMERPESNVLLEEPVHTQELQEPLEDSEMSEAPEQEEPDDATPVDADDLFSLE